MSPRACSEDRKKSQSDPVVDKSPVTGFPAGGGNDRKRKMLEEVIEIGTMLGHHYHYNALTLPNFKIFS